jgi:hypothetical protein
MSPERAAMLLAFHDENDVLTKRDIFSRANVRDAMNFTYLLEAKMLAPKEWVSNEPRRYALTPLGKDRREMYGAAENLEFG